MSTKYICDCMLARVGRWLRAAGYDTAIADSAQSDRQILEQAIAENRHLLTRDGHFLAMDAPQGLVHVLQGNSVDTCIDEITKIFALNWLYRPFTRCLLCNSELIKAPDVLVVTKVPADVQARSVEFLYCKSCQKVYWEGSHQKRMLSKLDSWMRGMP